ncbi:MAG: hypothetical protein ACM3UZ_05075 [Acidobacteriota bacterium]
MPPVFWFILLAVIAIFITTFTIYKKRSVTELSSYLVFYLFATSLSWIGEFIVLGFFNSYAYNIGVFANPWLQNLFAHLILNSFFWPGTAVLVAAYSLGFGWITLIAIVYMIIEYLFLVFGLYEHHWWRIYMTGITVVIFLTISRVWFARMNQIRQGYTRIVTLYFAALVIIHIPTPLLLLLGKQYYIMKLAPDMYLSSIIFILSYQMVETAIIVFFISVLKNWYWKLAPFVISIAGQYTLAKMGILVIQDGWNLTYSLVLYAVTLTAIILVEQYTLKPKECDS